MVIPLSAREPLPTSFAVSAGVFIRKRTEKDVCNLYLKAEELVEPMLHTLTWMHPRGIEIPPLSRGNYIVVSAYGADLLCKKVDKPPLFSIDFM